MWQKLVRVQILYNYTVESSATHLFMIPSLAIFTSMRSLKISFFILDTQEKETQERFKRQFSSKSIFVKVTKTSVRTMCLVSYLLSFMLWIRRSLWMSAISCFVCWQNLQGWIGSRGELSDMLYCNGHVILLGKLSICLACVVFLCVCVFYVLYSCCLLWLLSSTSVSTSW